MNSPLLMRLRSSSTLSWPKLIAAVRALVRPLVSTMLAWNLANDNRPIARITSPIMASARVNPWLL